MNKNNKYLFRYIPVDELRKYKNIFTKQQLYFSSPKNFNDPFDCKTYLSFKGCNQKDLEIFFINIIKLSFPSIGAQQLNKKVSVYSNEYNSNKQKLIKLMNSNLLRVLEEDTNPLGMLCLSEIPDDILMWSHYTNCHSGIVLQFLKEGLIKRFSVCEPIDYCEEFPGVKDWNKSDLSNFHRLFLLRKSNHWKYENEWRILTAPQNRKDKPGDRNLDFPKEILTGVIMGCQISKKHENKINGLIKDHCPHVKLHYAHRDENSYKIVFEPPVQV